MTREEEKMIIEQVLSGKVEEFRHLVIENQDTVFAMLRRQGIDEHTAKDISQETFLRAYRSLKKFKFNSSFSTWLTRIALNRSSSYFTSKHYINAQKSTDLEDLEIKCPEEDQIDKKIELLKKYVAKLDPKFREIIVLTCFENKSYKEVSEILDIPIGTVSSRTNRALHILREAFNNEDQAQAQKNPNPILTLLTLINMELR